LLIAFIYISDTDDPTNLRMSIRVHQPNNDAHIHRIILSFVVCMQCCPLSYLHFLSLRAKCYMSVNAVQHWAARREKTSPIGTPLYCTSLHHQHLEANWQTLSVVTDFLIFTTKWSPPVITSFPSSVFILRSNFVSLHSFQSWMT